MSFNEAPAAGQDPPRHPRGRPLRRIVGDISLTYRIILVVVVLAVLVIWAAGGFARAATPGVPTVGLRTPITAAPWRITVTDAAWVTGLPGAVVPNTKGDRLILVAAQLESEASDLRSRVCATPSRWSRSVVTTK